MMLLPLLLSAAQAPADHAHLHPADADFFLALPDVQATNRAYAQAPLSRILRDPDLGEFVREATELQDLRLDLAPLEALGLLPEALGLAPETGAMLQELLPELRSASLSIRGLRRPDAAQQRDLARLRAALQGVQEWNAHVEQWRLEHAGAPPGSLAELGRPEAALLDPWGHAYAFEAGGAGESWSVRSLGADGAPGGNFADTDVSARWEESSIAAAIALQSLGVQVVLDFATEHAAGAVHERLDRLPDTERLFLDGSRASLIRFEGFPHHQLWTLHRGTRLELGLSADASAAITAQMGRLTDAGGLGAHSAYQRGAELLAAGEGSSGVVLRAWQNLSWLQMLARGFELAATVEGAIGDEEVQAVLALLNTLTGDARTPEVWESHLLEGRFQTVSHRFPPAERTGLDAWLGREALDLDRLPPIPEDAMLVWGSSLDADALVGSLLELMQQVSGISADTWVRSMQESHGFHLREDLFAQLGESVLVHSQPLAGVGPPKLYATIELEDAETFWPAFEALGAFLGQELAGELSISGRPYRGVPILTFDPGISPMLEPSFCVLDGRLVGALSATHLKREIKRIDRGEEQAMVPVAQAFAAAGTPEAVGSVYRMEWDVLVGGLYDLLQSFGPMLSGMVELPVDLASLPPADGLVGPIEASWSLTHAGAQQRLTHAEGSWGPEMPLVLAAVAAMFLLEDGSSSAPYEIVEAPPNTDRAAIATTQHTLRVLMMGIAVYQTVNGDLPGDLSDLVATSDAWPRGYLDTLELPLDAWGRSLHYQVGEGGDTYRLWSLGPDGADQGGEGDDVLAP